MFFQKKVYKDEIIYTINGQIIDDLLVDNILCTKNKKIGIIMQNVKNINSKKFILNLVNNNFRLYNIRNEVLVFLAIILKDGFLKSYMTLEDLYNNKRELVKRHFLVA